ncbi:MAG: metallophosphoesterase family protein, partial [Spirochaetales bacterium]
MKIAVFSDIHDNIWNLATALSSGRTAECERLVFLGDFCAPFTLAQLAQGFSGPIDVVFGNNDGDTFLLSRIASEHDHVTLHGHLAELEMDGQKVALNHYPDLAQRLAESRAYDAVFSGHDHKKYIEQIGNTLWANPGEIMGRFGEPSFGVYDTATRSFEHVNVSSD